MRQLLCKNPKMRPSPEQIMKMPLMKVRCLGARGSRQGGTAGWSVTLDGVLPAPHDCQHSKRSPITEQATRPIADERVLSHIAPT